MPDYKQYNLDPDKKLFERSNHWDEFKTPENKDFNTSPNVLHTSKSIILGDNAIVLDPNKGIISKYIIGARAYKSANTQSIANNTYTHVEFDAADFDTDSSMDITTTTGTATATSANHLVDSNAAFKPSDVEKTIYNTTDTTYATITAWNSATDVTLSADIMADTENYRMYWSKYVCKTPGYYDICAVIYYQNADDQKFYLVRIIKNSTSIAQGVATCSGAQDFNIAVNSVTKLNTGDVLYVQTYQNSGTTEVVYNSIAHTFFYVIRRN